MFKSLAVILLFSAAAGLAAQEANDVNQPPSSVSSTIQQQLADLKARVDAEHQRIQELEQQLADRERGLNRLHEQMNELQINTLEKQSGNNFPAEYSAATNSTATPNVSNKEHPDAIHFRGITLTPGGFFDTTGIYRSHNENADVDSTFGGIPFSGTANAHLSEFRGSARASRLSLLAEGRINNWKASGYAEVDFEGAAPTANELESNSFNPRARQLWAQLEFNNGFSIAGGQTWSLLTTYRRGIQLRQEMVPITIDLQYVPGYNWARQWSFRVTKNFHKNMWAAFSVENPETSLSVINPPAGVFGFNTSPNATSPGSVFTLSNTPGANGISSDVAPDLIGKLVFEPGWGHYEIKAIGRFFRDRFDSSNNYTAGGGGGIGIVLPATKKLDLILEGLAGTGIGRYASGLGPDVSLRPDASIVPLRTLHTMAGLEWHPTSRWDWYVYGGDEFYSRASYTNPAGLPVGYGSRLNDNSGCQLESPNSSQPCQAQTRSLWQVQPGLWYRFYKGAAGTVALGMSYSYTNRSAWVGLDGLQPKGIENIVMTSFRYYFP
jgi:TolA-binding protein